MVLDDPIWPDEVARSRAAFFGIRTAALLVNERRWVHRRVEQIQFIDDRRAKRQISVDFTLPDLPDPPWTNGEYTWLVPIALLRRRLLISLDVRDESGASVPVLTREQNSLVARELLASLARETLTELLGAGAVVEPLLLYELSDITGARRNADDHPSEEERQRRTQTAIRKFRRAAIRAAQGPVPRSRLQDQRLTLWRDSAMRGFMTTLAERFVLLVPIAAAPGTRRIMKLSYEQALEVPPIVRYSWGAKRLKRPLELWPFVKATVKALWQRAAGSFGLDPLSFSAPTRAVFGPESYHVEIVAPDELLVDRARLDRITKVTSLADGRTIETRLCVAEDFRTERAHLYESLFTREEERPGPPSANEETTTASAISVDFFMRPDFVRPALLIGMLTVALLASGLVIHWIGVPRSGDVTALIVVLPAVFAAYLIPGEHRLVRRMFRGLRLLVFTVSVVSFVAAASLTISLSPATRTLVWIVLLALAVGSTGTIGAAYMASNSRLSRGPRGGVH